MGYLAYSKYCFERPNGLLAADKENAHNRTRPEGAKDMSDNNDEGYKMMAEMMWIQKRECSKGGNCAMMPPGSTHGTDMTLERSTTGVAHRNKAIWNRRWDQFTHIILKDGRPNGTWTCLLDNRKDNESTGKRRDIEKFANEIDDQKYEKKED